MKTSQEVAEEMTRLVFYILNVRVASLQYVNNFFEIVKEIDQVLTDYADQRVLEESKKMQDISELRIKQGRPEALEEAAKLIASTEGCGATFPNCDFCDCPEVLSEKVRALKDKP